jgi:hypothetical protein
MCNILFSSLNLTPFILFVCFAHSILFNLFQVLMIQTAQTRILIDISDSEDDHQEWDEKYWIGVGKKFPVSGEVPAFIEVARSKALALPPVYSLYIPSPKMSDDQTHSRSNRVDNRMLELTTAAIAVEIDEITAYMFHKGHQQATQDLHSIRSPKGHRTS